MTVIFYDRKNKRTVRSDKLMRARVVQSVQVSDGESWRPVDEIIGDVSYATRDCPKSQNWDTFCMETDLVFLRLA